MANNKINRILLKLSGEALLGKKLFGVDPDVLNYLAEEIKSIVDCDTQTGIVIGGGNIFRGEGLAQSGIDRVTGDQMGMAGYNNQCFSTSGCFGTTRFGWPELCLL